jgi:hypothetical protein
MNDVGRGDRPQAVGREMMTSNLLRPRANVAAEAPSVKWRRRGFHF